MGTKLKHSGGAACGTVTACGWLELDRNGSLACISSRALDLFDHPERTTSTSPSSFDRSDQPVRLMQSCLGGLLNARPVIGPRPVAKLSLHSPIARDSRGSPAWQCQGACSVLRDLTQRQAVVGPTTSHIRSSWTHWRLSSPAPIVLRRPVTGSPRSASEATRCRLMSRAAPMAADHRRLDRHQRGGLQPLLSPLGGWWRSGLQ